MDDAELEQAVSMGPLGRLPEDLVERLLSGATSLHVPAGQIMAYPGQGQRLNLMLSGLLRASLGSVEGRRVTIRYCRAGEVLGLAWPVGDEAMPISAQAVTDVEIVRTQPHALQRIARTDPRMSTWLAEELNWLVNRMFEEIARNTFLDVKRRLAGHLLDLATERQSGKLLVVNSTQQDLADSVGTVREVVARTLQLFKKEGFVDVAPGRGVVRIIDAKALSELSMPR